MALVRMTDKILFFQPREYDNLFLVPALIMLKVLSNIYSYNRLKMAIISSVWQITFLTSLNPRSALSIINYYMYQFIENYSEGITSFNFDMTHNNLSSYEFHSKKCENLLNILQTRICVTFFRTLYSRALKKVALRQ